MKNIRVFFIWKFSVFGGELFYIFELACFRNGYVFCHCGSFVDFSTLGLEKNFASFVLQNAPRFWSDCASAHTDLNHCRAHMSVGRTDLYSDVAAQFYSVSNWSHKAKPGVRRTCWKFYSLYSSSAYLFEDVFVKCVCILRTSVFFQFYGVLSGVIYKYSPPLFYYYSKSHFCSRELCY